MTSKIWLESDGLKLKNLRIDAGFHVDVLARDIGISRKMLLQLEDGGDSAFYSSSIKFQTGRKLLRHLGSDVSNPEAPFFDAEHAKLDSTKKEILKTVDEIIRVSEQSLEENFIKDFVLDLKDWLQFHKILIAFIAISAIFIIAIIYKHSSFMFSKTTAQAVRMNELLDIQVSAQSMASSSNEQAVTIVVPASFSSEKSTIKDSSRESMKFADATFIQKANELSIGKSPSLDCKWSDGSTLTYSPNPTKSGSYVYMVATQDIAFCVMDKGNVSNSYELNANADLKITGSPPFRLYSQNLKSLKIFYQGYRVMSGDSSEITLQERQIAQ